MAADKVATGMSPLRAWTGCYAAMAPLPSSWGVSSLGASGSTPLPFRQRTSSRATTVRPPLPTDPWIDSTLIVSFTIQLIVISAACYASALKHHTIARPRRADIHESFLHQKSAWAATTKLYHRTSQAPRPRYWHAVTTSTRPPSEHSANQHIISTLDANISSSITSHYHYHLRQTYTSFLYYPTSRNWFLGG